MQNYNLKAMKNQAGMTLIELTVVLLVLIGLAGLTIPYVGGFIGKTHNSTSAAAGADLYNALAMYQTNTTSLPNNLNLLTDNSAAAVTAIPNYIDNTGVNAGVKTAATAAAAAAANVPTNFAITTPAAAGTVAGIIGSLKQAGINLYATLPTAAANYSYMVADGTFVNTAVNGATFTTEGTGVTTPLAFVTDKQNQGAYTLNSATCLANAPATITCPNGGIANALNYTPGKGFGTPANHQMIVLGIGAANSAVGNSLTSVPVHFGDKGNLQPQYTYSRFMVAIDVDATGSDPAKMIGIVHAPDTNDQWESLYSSISGYYGS